MDEATNIEAHRKRDREKRREIEEHQEIEKHEEFEKHEGQLAECFAQEFTRQEKVVRRREYGGNLSAGRLIQERREDDCAEPGFETGVAEGTRIRDADADLLCEPRREEPEREPSAGAGAGKGTAAPKD